MVHSRNTWAKKHDNAKADPIKPVSRLPKVPTDFFKDKSSAAASVSDAPFPGLLELWVDPGLLEGVGFWRRLVGLLPRPLALSKDCCLYYFLTKVLGNIKVK